MALVEKILYQGLPGIADTALYTVPAAKKTTVTAILCGNTDTVTRWVTLHVVPNGSAASNTNIFGGKQKKLVGTNESIGGGEILYEFPFPLKTGDKLSSIQESSGAISVTIIGIEEDV